MSNQTHKNYAQRVLSVALATVVAAVLMLGVCVPSAWAATGSSNSSSAVDTTAPVLDIQSASRTGGRTATVEFTSTEAGTYYWAVGQEATAAGLVASASNATVMVAGENTVQVASLTSKDLFHFWVCGVDSAGNISSIQTVQINPWVDLNPNGGWFQTQNGWQYLVDDLPVYGWQKLSWSGGTDWFYFDTTTGYMDTGWLHDGVNWYYLDPTSGAMKTGWLDYNNQWYYLNSNGAMAGGWLEYNNQWYYLEPGYGYMHTGWVQWDGSWYYLDPYTGAMHTGWVQVGSTWYYLDPTSGAMYTGTHVINGTTYTFASSGAWIQ
jgi:hypothetical protein